MKILESFDQAVEDISDGATLMFFSWMLLGNPCNLIRALYNKGAKDLTVITHCCLPALLGPVTFTQEECTTSFLLADRIKKLISAWPSSALAGVKSPLIEKVTKGEAELETTSHGTLIERIRAGGCGIGGFYTLAGVGTVFAEGKETKTLNGREYILETPLHADFCFVKAYKADLYGNLIFRNAERGSHPIMAMASKITIAEVEEIVDPGELAPAEIVTPGIFIDRVVKIPEGGMGTKPYMDNLLKKYLREVK